MKNTHESRSLLEMRKWKEKVGRDIEKLGAAEAGRRADEKLARHRSGLVSRQKKSSSR